MFGLRLARPPQPRDLGRRALVARARRFAARDAEFQALIAAASQARAVGDFAAAAAACRQALRRYPLHGGTWAQLGHAARRQDDWIGAEIAFRAALALGEREPAPPLACVVERGGGTYDRTWTDQVAAYWQGTDPDRFATPPAPCDVADAIELLCDRGEPDPTELRDLLAACATRRALLVRLLQGGEFRRYHAPLLRFVAETGWRG